MSKKQKQNVQKEKSTSEYYKLNTKAVDDLAYADESNSPEVSEEELRKYRSGSKFKVADWLKVLFIKFWFPAAVCYFFFWGLGNYVTYLLDMMVITGIALGIVTDLLTNNVIRFFSKTEGGYDRWMMFPKKGYITFPLNILYAWVVLFLVFVLYNVINMAIIAVTGAVDTIPLGVEPVMFGLFYLGCDMLLIEAKHMCGRIIRDARNKTKMSRG